MLKISCKKKEIGGLFGKSEGPEQRMGIIRTVYMEPCWGKIQEQKDGGRAETFCYEGIEGKIVYPYIRRRAGIIDGVEYFDTVTPRGKCGPIAFEKKDESLYLQFDRAFQNYCDKTKIVAEYINFDPWNTNYDKFRDIYKMTYHGFEFCFSLEGDFFMNEFSTTRRRYIRKAIRKGVDIEVDASWDRIGDFLKVYDFTVQKHNVSQFYSVDKSFFDDYREKLGNKVKLGYATYDGKIIASGIFLEGKDVFHYHFDASNPEYLKLNAMSLLLYREAKEATKLGCKIFDLGSAVIGCNLEMFKGSMCNSQNILQTYVGTAVRNQKIYDELVEINGKTKEGYFPAYRRL
jgi:serine/alanine adding enzyme